VINLFSGKFSERTKYIKNFINLQSNLLQQGSRSRELMVKMNELNVQSKLSFSVCILLSVYGAAITGIDSLHLICKVKERDLKKFSMFEVFWP